MVDRPPPQRYRVIERNGRLEVFDSETGGRPQSAAERMALQDAANGYTTQSFHRFDAIEDFIPPTATVAEIAARTAPTDGLRAALAQQPKSRTPVHASRPQLGAQSDAEAQARPGLDGAKARLGPAPRDKQQPMVTGKWWDARGPRTLNLGAAGRQRLTTGFATALVVSFFIAMVLLIIQPVLLMAAGFLMFRFGAKIFAPLGARLIDEAIRADGSGR